VLPEAGLCGLALKVRVAVWVGLGVLAWPRACQVAAIIGNWLPWGVICGGSKSVERVCAAFGLTAGPGASITPVSRGAMGRVWCLDLGAERYAVKELFRESDEESVRPEVTFTAHLESAGIRLPGSVPGRGGRFLQELAADDGDGWLRLYRWIDGLPVDLAEPGLAVQIGDLVGRLHALAPPAWGAVDAWYDSVPEPATWDQLADAAHRQGAGWGDAMAEHAGLLRDLADLMTPMARDRLVICHRDLHPDNVLVEATGELAVLDWDDAGPACPGRELAGLLMFWHVDDNGTVDDAAVERTLAAYRAAADPGRLRDEQSFGMYIACRLNFLEGQASVALDPGAAPEDRAYASSEISDTLARLPTRSMISHLTSLATTTLG
jgi:Ser/Thr protein kinase RdoA (MazF antagonist)